MSGTIESRINNVTGGGGASVPSAGAVLSNGSSLTSVAAGTSGNILTDNGTTWVSSAPSGGSSVIDPTSTSSVIQNFDDFTAYNYQAGNQYPIGPLNLSYSGTVARVAPLTNEQNRIGLIQSSCNASSSYNGYFSDIQDIMFGECSHTLATSVYIPTLPTMTNSFGYNWGFGDSFPTWSNGAYFVMNYLNSTWQANTYSNATGTTYVNTGITVTTGWTNLRIVINAAGTSAAFYVNGSLGTTITTNIPTAYPCGISQNLIWYAGTGPFTCKNDWLMHNYQLSSARGTL